MNRNNEVFMLANVSLYIFKNLEGQISLQNFICVKRNLTRNLI